MKALVLKEYKQFALEEVETPVAGPDDVLVAVRACGICGSDVHGMDGGSGRRRPPIIMGHEAAGVVARVGRNVRGVAPGDRVTLDSTIYCGQCHHCRAGRVNLCDHRRVLGVSCEEYRRHGAFAEFVAVPERTVHRLPAGLEFEQAALVEPVAIAVHAVQRVPIRLNDTAVVVGAGMIGLLVIQALRLAGCGRVIAVDIAGEKLELARRLGATDTVDPRRAEPVAAVRGLTDGCGADVAFDAVGTETTLGLAVQAVRKGGAVGLVGNLAPSAPLPLQAVVTRELTLYGSCASAGEYPACLELIARGAVNVAPLISAVAPLADGARWFERLYQHEPGLLKVVLAPTQGGAEPA